MDQTQLSSPVVEAAYTGRDEECSEYIPGTDLESTSAPRLYIRPSLLPYIGIGSALTVLIVAVTLTIALDQDIGGHWYPYISECGMGLPQAPLFAFGLTVTSVCMILSAILQHAKISHDLSVFPAIDGSNTNAIDREEQTGFSRTEKALKLENEQENMQQQSPPRGCWQAKRRALPFAKTVSRITVISGTIGPPFLGLLGSYDARRFLYVHNAFVVLFFTSMTIHMSGCLFLYSFVARLAQNSNNIDAGFPNPKLSQAAKNITSSLRWKKKLFFVIFGAIVVYLPLSFVVKRIPINDEEMSRVRGKVIHVVSAVCQQITVLCMLLFYGSYGYFDFASLKLEAFITYSNT